MISVIIPTLNEAAGVAATIASVTRQSVSAEVVVVDGGSRDGTIACARPLARVLEAPRGRASQMNAGAAVASGDVLVFLHADSCLSQGSLAAVGRAIRDGAAGGAFRLAFDRRHPILDMYAFCARLPWRLLCFGDRGLFVRRNVFDSVGGFPAMPIFEDLEMVRLVRRYGPFQYLPNCVTTAARRFERHGLLAQQFRNAVLWSHYVIGTEPARLADRYSYD